MKTVLSPYKYELTVLGSRFIGILTRVTSKEDFDLSLSKIKEDYPKATHYVYAFTIDKANEGCSDDGEPSRSAGLPLLNIVRGASTIETSLVIVRYFGGTKLGLPRLTRTYRDIGKILVSQADFAEIIKGESLTLKTDYSSFEEAKRLFFRAGLETKNEKFDTKVIFNVTGDAKIVEPLLKGLNKLEVERRENTEILRRIDK